MSYGLAAAETGRTPQGYTSVSSNGPVIAVSGSRSPVADRQIRRAEQEGWCSVDVFGGSTAEVTDTVHEALTAGRNVVVHSARSQVEPDEIDSIGHRLAELVLLAVEKHGTARVIVAGGDTSGRILTELDVRAIELVSCFGGGAFVCRVRSGLRVADGLEVALKGGQMGAEDYLLVAAGLTPDEG